MGHVMGREGIRVDHKKIKEMQEWPQPRTLKILNGFLGLTGYYRKFSKNYGCVTKPLTNLIKENEFLWTQQLNRTS